MDITIKDRLKVGQFLLFGSIVTFVTIVTFRILYPSNQCAMNNFWAMVFVIVFLVLGNIMAFSGLYLVFPYFRKKSLKPKGKKK